MRTTRFPIHGAALAGCVLALSLIQPGFAAARTWDGEGADALASNPTNWSDNVAPTTGDGVVLDATSHKPMTWDLDIPVASWTQNGYTGTVTIATVYPGQGTFTNFVIQNDCEILSGFLAHSANTTAQKHRLFITVGGDLTIGSAGSVHADARGYMGSGPGAAEGAAYGGCGAHGLAGTSRCYGSITDPADLGSGGRNNSRGGGALLLRVAGTMRNDGNCSADGEAISEVPSLKLAVANEAERAVFRVRDGAWLRLTNDFMVGDVFLETANARLLLNGWTLSVNALKHSLAPGTVVTNNGHIVWLRPGTLFMLR